MTAARHAILRILWGPLAAQRRIIPAGEVLRVGRTDRCHLALAQDAQMSAAHFEITWDGVSCRVRDLDSARGTLLGGARVSEAEVPNGGWIRAGDTHFRLYLEAHTPPPGDEQEIVASLGAEKEAALSLLRREAEEAPLFALVDASRSHRALQILHESIDEERSLYDGIKGEALAGVAPHLVTLDRRSDLLDRLVREGWGRRWMIFFTSARPPREVRRHLRRFLLVEDDDNGRRLYFRYHDPRVLRVFLPACTPRQRQDFFGEIQCFIVEGERAEPVRFTPDPGG